METLSKIAPQWTPSMETVIDTVHQETLPSHHKVHNETLQGCFQEAVQEPQNL